MKKIFKLVGGITLLVLVTGAAYFLFVLNSKGTDEIRYIEPEEEYSSFDEILSHPELKGKVIYVDYWHTGCTPCLEEFEYLPEVKNNFEDSKDLTFLYLGKDRSAPGEKFRWKKMIEKKNLTGYHYFMTNEKFRKLWDETVNDTSIFRAFPHYLIVDRNGEIVNNDAPKPSDPKLVDEIMKALSI